MPNAAVPSESKALVPAQVAAFKALVAQSQEAIRAVAPQHLNADRLGRLVTVAFQRNPALAECAPITVLGTVLQAAALGLELEDGTQRAYPVPFFNRKKNRKECQLIIGYRGFVSLMHNTGLIKDIHANVVHSKDHFEYELGSSPFVRHKPSDDADPGGVTHAYFVVDFVNGGRQQVVMTVHQIEKRRRRSQMADGGAWKNDYDSMCLKTVVREGSKLVPVSSDRVANFHRAVDLDGRASAGKAQDLGIIVSDKEEATPDDPADTPRPDQIEGPTPAEQARQRLAGRQSEAIAPPSQVGSQIVDASIVDDPNGTAQEPPYDPLNEEQPAAEPPPAAQPALAQSLPAARKSEAKPKITPKKGW